MRIKIVQKPRIPDADGIRLDFFEVGFQYEVGNSVGALLLAEGWAVPVRSDEPGVVIPVGNDDRGNAQPPNLVRVYYGDDRDLPPNAAEKRSTPRKPGR